MPEAKLAREAELCYATVAMVTDFDCWHPDHDHVQVADVIAVLRREQRQGAAAARRTRSRGSARRRRERAVPARLRSRARERDPDRARGARSRALSPARRGRRPRARDEVSTARWRRTIELAADGRAVDVLDQARLPYEVAWRRLATLDDVARAIRDMHVRGAPLIGATAAYGVALALPPSRPTPPSTTRAPRSPRRARPRSTCGGRSTRCAARSRRLPPASAPPSRSRAPRSSATTTSRTCEAIGTPRRSRLIRAAAERVGDRPVRVLTHCNAGWLATVDWGTALAPIYKAHEAGIRVARLGRRDAAAQPGAAHRVGARAARRPAHRDRRQRGRPPACSAARSTCASSAPIARPATATSCNKIGTYLKALAAHDEQRPVLRRGAVVEHRLDDRRAAPRSRSRSAAATRCASSRPRRGRRAARSRSSPPTRRVANPAFDVTPAPPRHRARHRARRHRGHPRRPRRAVPGARADDACACATSWSRPRADERARPDARHVRQRQRAQPARPARHAVGHAVRRARPPTTSSRSTLDGAARPGQRTPSTEWQLHRDILAARRDVAGDRPHALAVLHDASPACAARSRRSTTWSSLAGCRRDPVRRRTRRSARAELARQRRHRARAAATPACWRTTAWSRSAPRSPPRSASPPRSRPSPPSTGTPPSSASPHVLDHDELERVRARFAGYGQRKR